MNVTSLKPRPMFETPIVSNPDPMEAVIISRAQSILTKNGQLGPILPYEEALKVVEGERKAS